MLAGSGASLDPFIGLSKAYGVTYNTLVFSVSYLG